MPHDNFPFLYTWRERRHNPGWPEYFPWRLLAPHEDQAKQNHCGQDLATLARRGGLGPEELYAVLTDQRYSALDPTWPTERFVEILRTFAADNVGYQGRA